MNILLHNSHTKPNGAPDGSGAPGESKWVMALNDEIEVRARAIGIVVTRVAGDLKDHPEFHADYDAFLAPHYDANIYGHGCWFWDRAKASTTPDLDDKLGAIFKRRYSMLPDVPNYESHSNANTFDYYGFRLTSEKTPGYLVEHGVGAPNAPDNLWLNANVGAIAQTHVDTWAEYGNVSDQKRYYVFGSSSPIAVPSVDSTIIDLYRSLCPQVGIRTEIAVAQALHETNWFRFTGDAKAEWHNPAGIGVGASSGAINCEFATWEKGIRAQLGHLLAYFSTTPNHVQGFCDIDPRHFPHRGYANDIRNLNHHWAIPGDGYGEAIANVVDAIVTGNALDFWNHVDSAPFTWGDMKQYAQRLQAQLDQMRGN